MRSNALYAMDLATWTWSKVNASPASTFIPHRADHSMGRLSSNELLLFGGEGFGDHIHDDFYSVKVETQSTTGEVVMTAKRLTYVLLLTRV